MSMLSCSWLLLPDGASSAVGGLDLSSGDVPAYHDALERFYQEEEGDAQYSQHENASENQPRVELAVGDQNQIAQPLVGADELADDRADHGKRARNLEAAENGG